jgi:hypothetical protein
MRSSRALVALALICSACGVPSSPSKQAEEIASVASEGALLAHEAGGGDSFTAFTRVHAEALAERLSPLEPKIENERLAILLARTTQALETLAAAPGDEERAARLERALERLADEAQELES